MLLFSSLYGIVSRNEFSLVKFDSSVFLSSSFINVINSAFVPFHVGILIDVFCFEIYHEDVLLGVSKCCTDFAAHFCK